MLVPFRLIHLHAHALPLFGSDRDQRAPLQRLGLYHTRTLGSVDHDLLPNNIPRFDRELRFLGVGSGLDEFEVSRDFGSLVREETSLVSGHPAESNSSDVNHISSRP